MPAHEYAVERLDAQQPLNASQLGEEDVRAVYPFTPEGEPHRNLAHMLALARRTGRKVMARKVSSGQRSSAFTQSYRTLAEFVDTATTPRLLNERM